MPTAAPIPRLLAVSDRDARRGRRFDAWLEELAEAGVDGVQVREKALPDRELWELASLARQVFRHRIVLVNGRADVAFASGADGVHLPADGVPVAAVRAAWGPALAIGRSTHREEEVAAAARDGADFVTFGPVFATPSKAAWGAPAGLARLAAVASRSLPVIALGGIAPERLEAVAAAGAWGVAGIRAFHDPAMLQRLVEARDRAWQTP